MFSTADHRQLHASLETVGAAFAIFELTQGAVVLVSGNALFEEVIGTALTDGVGKSLAEIAPRYVEKPMREAARECVSKQTPVEAELVVERSAVTRWWRLLASPIRATPPRAILTLIEITEKKLLELELNSVRQRFEAVVETAYDGVISIDEQQTIQLMNESARYIFGVQDDEVIGTNLSRFIPQRFRGNHHSYVTSFRHSTLDARPMESRQPVRGLKADGMEFPVEVTISKIKVGSKTEMTAVIRDISERARLIEELERAASHDPLTGVYNRRHGDKVLTTELSRCVRFKRHMSLVTFDIDHFKRVNDEYGHACGDEVLKQVAVAVGEGLREADVLCRWGGEEFLVILPETAMTEAVNTAERLRQCVAALLPGCQAKDLRLTASFGVATYPEHGASIDQLLDRADEAMYRAKRGGRNRVEVAANAGVVIAANSPS